MWPKAKFKARSAALKTHDQATAHGRARLTLSLARNEATAYVAYIRRAGRVCFHEALGHAQKYTYGGYRAPLQRLPAPPAVTRAHLFDLSSVSKVVATTLAVLTLVSDGKLRLDEDVAEILPLPPAAGGAAMRVDQLLSHRSGLPAWVPLYFDLPGRDALVAALAPYVARATPGVAHLYSDLGFLLLGAVVEARAGCNLQAYLRRRAWLPLQLKASCYDPRGLDASQVVATGHANIYERRMIDEPAFGLRLPSAWQPRPSHAFGRWRNHTVCASADDGNAHYAMQGVAGHAGQFAPAHEVGTLLRAMAGPMHSPEVKALALDESVRQAFLHSQLDGNFLGWFAGPALGLSPAWRTMRGFTGTLIAVHPQQDVQMVLLGNREHVDAHGHYANLRGVFEEVAGGWIRAWQSALPGGGM